MKGCRGFLPGFEPPSVSRCRVCGRRLSDPESIASCIGPKCKAAEEADEHEFLDRMDSWNAEGDDKSYPCVTMGDINRLLGIIRRLKREQK